MDKLAESMAKAGMEEKQLVVKRGDYHKGVTAITIVC